MPTLAASKAHKGRITREDGSGVLEPEQSERRQRIKETLSFLPRWPVEDESPQKDNGSANDCRRGRALDSASAGDHSRVKD
ncbi:hypothetical protein R1flu_006830 [Riccia fluitans]|uniref:Uncharacterized protein n=1 Tax=Riccia fluitans TaxID=41844 RepID=A0ABD1YX53_9MARC